MARKALTHVTIRYDRTCEEYQVWYNTTIGGPAFYPAADYADASAAAVRVTTCLADRDNYGLPIRDMVPKGKRK